VHARRHTRVARLTIALAAPLALLLALPTAAHAALDLPSPGSTAPDAVVRSLQPGGDVFAESVDLDATGLDGTTDPSARTPDTTRFGRVHLELSFEPRTRATAPELTSGDVAVASWVAIEYRDDEPVASIELDLDGAFACLGGCRLPVEVADTAESLPDDVAIVAAGIPTQRSNSSP
jgi:hypothetical protein